MRSSVDIGARRLFTRGARQLGTPTPANPAGAAGSPVVADLDALLCMRSEGTAG
jgi:hypothetical protein